MTQGQPPVTDVFRWIKLLQDHEPEVKSKLTEPQAARFGTGVRQLTDDLSANPDNSGEIGAEFVQFVGQYQPVDEWLQQKDANFKAFRTGSGDTDVAATSPPGLAAGAAAAAPGAADPWDMMQDGHSGEDGTRIVGVPINGQQQPEETGQERRDRSGKVAKNNNKEPWTPEFKMQFFKETITALLGLVIIGFTLWFALRCFNLVGNTKKIGDAKDLLTILLGLAGVVVGYYFGRVPADARAAQATNRADTAVRQREQVKAQARGISGQLDNLFVADGGGNLTRASGVAPANIAGLRSIRDQLHDLGGPTE